MTVTKTLVLSLLLVLLRFDASAQPASNTPLPPKDVVHQAWLRLSALRAQLDEAKRSFDPQDAKEIQARYEETSRTLEKLAALAEKGPENNKAAAPLIAAAGVVVADDPSGVGVADNVLLPVIGLALIATHVKAQITASDELTKATQNFAASTQARASFSRHLCRGETDPIGRSSGSRGRCACDRSTRGTGPTCRGIGSGSSRAARIRDGLAEALEHRPVRRGFHCLQS